MVLLPTVRSADELEPLLRRPEVWSPGKGLRKSRTATATWSSMTPAMRRDMVQWVTSAKQDDTRARRLSTSLTKLAEGEKRVY